MEVETDDEIKVVEEACADIVETDDELKDKLKTASVAQPVWCLWGWYEPARLRKVEQNLHQVRFEDGSLRWATAGELVIDGVGIPTRWLQPGATILRPADEEPMTEGEAKRTVLVQGTLARRVSAGSDDDDEVWEVRLDNGASTLSTHRVSELRLPVTHGGVLGSGRRLTHGLRIHALRGEWRRGMLSGTPSRDRGRPVKLNRIAADGVGGEPLAAWGEWGAAGHRRSARPSRAAAGCRRAQDSL